MQILKRFVLLFTLVAFVCAATGCATTGRGVATSNHASHHQSKVVKPVDEEGSSGYSTGTKALAIGAGAIVVIGVLAVGLVYLGLTGMGQGLAGSVAMH